MATQAHGANIFQIALASAFDDGNYVIRIPQTFARPATQAPMLEKRDTICAACVAQLAGCCNRIDSAGGANAAIALENLFTEIPRLGAQFPLVHAERRAEGVATTRHLKRAPAAQSTTIRAARNRLAINPTTAHDPRRAHRSVLNCAVWIGSRVWQDGYKEKHARRILFGGSNGWLLRRWRLRVPGQGS